MVAAMLVGCGAAMAAPFSFQGELRDAGVPVNGVYDLQFSLYSAVVGGVQVGSTVCVDNVTVTDGRFAVMLDYGAAFDGWARYLEIQLRPDTGLVCGNNAGFSTLGPRAQVTNAPMSDFANQAGAAASAANATNLGGQPGAFYQNAANLTGVLADTRLSANVPKLNSATSAFTGAVSATSFAGAGTSLTGLNATNLASGTVADARLSTNIPKLNTANVFAGGITAPSFVGSGVGLSSLNAGALSSGTVADVRLSTNVALQSAANSFSAINTFNNRVGIGTAPATLLHVSGGASGATPSAASELVIEDNSSSYVQILTPDASERGVAFGSPSSGFEGGVYYSNTTGMSLRTGGNGTRMTISPTGDVAFAGAVSIPSTQRFVMLSGFAFTTLSGVSRFGEQVISSGGAATGFASAPVQLPHGAHVDSVTVYGGDLSANNFTVTLVSRQVDPISAPTTMATVTSSGSAGTITRWATSTITDADVDTSVKLYYVQIVIPGSTAAQDHAILGVRIAYSVTAPLP